MKEKKKISISLKYKLLLLLTVIPVVSLLVYIFIATRLFEKDKIAYVKDSTVAVAKSLSVQFRTEVNGFGLNVKSLLSTFDTDKQTFSAESTRVFEGQDRIDAIMVYQRQQTGDYRIIADLRKTTGTLVNSMFDVTFLNKLRERAVSDQLFITSHKDSKMHLIFAQLIGSPKDTNHMIVVGYYRAVDLYSAFARASIYTHFLINSAGEVLLGPDGKTIPKEALDEGAKCKTPECGSDVAAAVPMIAGFADTAVGGTRVVSLASRKEALSAVDVLIAQSALFFLALIASTVIISVIAAVKLTSTLRELYEATKKVSLGEFDVRVSIQSSDEIGGLADGFNIMAEKVSVLMKETQNKARMEAELETVKIVQETLFPAPSTECGPYKIVGHFEPASECGGDWWYYSKTEDRLFLWIGDATGHGAPAAMVTSAAKSAVSIIERMPDITPSKAMEILNRAIRETTNGKILMTFFVAAIDLKTHQMTYSNASHEAPYIVRRSGSGKVTKKNLIPLIDVNGKRLGDSPDSKYKEHQVQLQPGDSIVFYTDGIIDVKNTNGDLWGERGFVRSICESATNNKTASTQMTGIRKSISDYRQESHLIDDVTLFICEYEAAA